MNARDCARRPRSTSNSARQSSGADAAGSAAATVQYMSAPLSIRFDRELLSRLRDHARSVPGGTPSGLAQRLVDEGLRMADHPGVIFKDGPSGRRAALAHGPDIWEVVKALREMDERGEAAVDAAAEVLNIASARIRAAMRYYGAYPQEIDAEIEQADVESAEAQAVWSTAHRLLR